MDKYNLDHLVKDVAAGDANAYRKLLEVSARLVRGYVLAKMPTGRADAEDVVQETLLAVHLKYNSYDPSLPFLPWLRTIAHHKLVDHWRKKNISGAVPLEEDVIDARGDESANTNAALTLEKLLMALPEKQQTIVRLARIDGKSMQEIADELKLTVPDVKVTLHRALKKLAENAKENETA